MLMLAMSANGLPTQLEIIMSKSATNAVKTPGKCAALHEMWDEAGEGQPLPRSFAIEMAIASGANASTARTQIQRWLSTFAQREQLAALVGETTH